MKNAVYSVSDLTGRLKAYLEASFRMVWVRGEVTGVRETGSGHVYFTLKDARSQLSCVWFAGMRRAAERANFDPLTGEVFAPGEGVGLSQLRQGGEFLCSGTISFYPQGGSCQLLVEHVLSTGAGALAQAFEARKQELAAKGYFAPERKRKIPENPSRIALITSEQGAAIRDFLKIARDRGLSSHIRLFPTLVQGSGAAEMIAQAIREASSQNWAEVIVVIRGGGSLEDLWCFNEKIVADAVFEAAIPVVAGIGHEIDVTLADMTADLRAATPTHAAELLWTPRERFSRDCKAFESCLGRRISELLNRTEQKLAHEERSLNMLSPVNQLRTLEERLANVLNLFQMRIATFLSTWEDRYGHLMELFIRLMSPARLETRLEQLNHLEQRLSAGSISSLEEKRRLLESLEERVGQRTAQKIDELWLELEKNRALLVNSNPLTLLERGYALVEDEAGHLVRSVDEMAPGDGILVRLADGRLKATVTGGEKVALEEG